MSGFHIDSFSAGLDDLTRRQAKNWRTVLRVLDRVKRFSVFEATANDDIARTMTDLASEQYKFIVVDDSPGYPWSNVALTDAGRAYLNAEEPSR